VSNGFTSAWLAVHESKRSAREPAPSSISSKLESQLQQQIAERLASFGRNCYFVWHRTDRPSTCKVGTPDFVGFAFGRPFAIEVKVKGGKVSTEQHGHLFHAQLAGAKTCVVWSLPEAEEFIAGLSHE
jgi:hypothetical protein